MQANLSLFLEWAETNGLKISPRVSVQHLDDVYGFGGLMNDEVVQSELPYSIIRIPLSVSINAHTALNSEFGKAFKLHSQIIKQQRATVGEIPTTGVQNTNNDLFEDNNVLFYLFLVYERFVRNRDSFWFPYLQLLPERFDTTIFFTQQQLNKLKGTNLLKSTLNIRDKLGQLWHNLVVPLQQVCPEYFTKDFSFERFTWAFSCVWSRVFPVKGPSTQPNGTAQIYPTLLPLIDILNHEFNSQVTYNINYEEGFFSLESRAPLVKGAQVFNNYGAKSNDSFLLSYGFVVPNNREDTYYIQLGFNDADEDLVLHKQQIISKLGYKLGHYLRKDCLPEGLIPSLRVCAMNSFEVYFHSVSNANAQTFSNIISFRNEHAVFQSLNRLLRQKINVILDGKSYQQVVDELTHITKQIPNPSHIEGIREYNIAAYKLGQLQVLSHSFKTVKSMEKDYITGSDLLRMLPNGVMYRNEIVQPSPLELDQGEPSKKVMNNTAWLQSKNQFPNKSFVSGINDSDMCVRVDAMGSNKVLCLNMNECINYTTVCNDPLGRCIQKINNEELFDEETTIMMYVLYHKFCPVVSCTSRFKHFFEALPNTWNTTLFYAPHVLQLLENTSLYEDTKDLKQQLEETFHFIYNSCCQSRQFAENFNVSNTVLCFENFLWAYTAYDTLVRDGNIIPVFGLYSPLHYRAKSQICQYTSPDNTVRVKLIHQGTNDATGSFVVGGNLLATLHNDELMLRYGALFTQESDFFFPLTLDSASLEPLLDSEHKQSLLEHLHLGFDHFLRKRIGRKVKPPIKLFNMLRICFMNKEEAQMYYNKIVVNNQVDSKIIINNESHVVNTVRSVLSSILDSFPTSLQDDEHLLKKLEREDQSITNVLSKRENVQKTMCVRYRMQLKQVVELTLLSLESSE